MINITFMFNIVIVIQYILTLKVPQPTSVTPNKQNKYIRRPHSLVSLTLMTYHTNKDDQCNGKVTQSI